MDERLNTGNENTPMFDPVDSNRVRLFLVITEYVPLPPHLLQISNLGHRAPARIGPTDDMFPGISGCRLGRYDVDDFRLPVNFISIYGPIQSCPQRCKHTWAIREVDDLWGSSNIFIIPTKIREEKLTR